jgi:hypothetical protein
MLPGMIPVIAGGERDPYFANVSLLLHMDGTNGATTFTDSSSFSHSVSAFGNAQITTSASVFGGASGRFDGSGDYLTVPNHSSLQLGTGDFTIEFWCRCASISSFSQIISKGFTGSGGLYLQQRNNGGLNLGMNGAEPLNANGMFAADGVFHFYQITRSGSALALYRDGTLAATGTSSANLNSTAALNAAQSGSGGNYFNGWLDDLRITKGIARPPSVPEKAFLDA